MITNILLLILGFFILIKGADFFVDSASSLAGHLKIPKILIGLTIVAFGTSAPEFAISMNALAHHSTDLLLGNVIGSNILNVLLILGIAAVIHPINIRNNTVKKELPLTMLISTLLAVLFLDNKLGNGSVNSITRADALVILLFFSIFLYYLIALAKKKREEDYDEPDEQPKYSVFISIILFIVGLAGIIIGSDLVVKCSQDIATSLHISQRVISLTIIAFGTSLPELTTTIVSSKKKEQDLLVGNIIGSNIFNICIVLGIPVTIYGSVTPGSFQIIDIISLVASSIALFIFSESARKITKLEGVLLLMAFAVYYTLVFVL
jgi:cation:H+ antiporter